MPLSPCRECGHQVSSEATACPSCGVPNPSTEPPPLNARHWEPQPPAQPQVVYVQRQGPSGGIAAVLSFFLPGLGQLYKGQAGRGLLWFFASLIGYAMLIFPGLLIHLFCVINAMSTDAD
jgi:TM2 domain-containing membrane protein YozV